MIELTDDDYPPMERWLTKEEIDRFYEYSEAVEAQDPFNLSPERIRAYDLYLDNIRVYLEKMREAWKEGYEQGYREGYEKGYREGLKILLAIVEELRDGSSMAEIIASKHNVSLEFVKKIESSLNRLTY